MCSRWFTSPDPAYGELVARLYGPATGGALNAAYQAQLARRDLWSHRLDWRGLLIADAQGRPQAHAVIQEVRDRPAVYVGFVEAENDPAVVAGLMAAIRQHVAAHYPDRPVYLPVNLSIWHSYRFRTTPGAALPFDPPTQPYYSRLFAGFLSQEESYSSYRIPLPVVVAEPRPPPGYTLRAVTLPTLIPDLRTIYELSAAIFESAHSVPSFAEFRALHGEAVGTVDLHYVLLVEEAARPVGFIYAIPQDDRLFVKTLAVLPDYQRRGVGRLLYSTVCHRARAAGCRVVYGLTMRDDRLITRLVPPGAEKVAEYMLYKET